MRDGVLHRSDQLMTLRPQAATDHWLETSRLMRREHC
jgi:hypothetical protein